MPTSTSALPGTTILNLPIAITVDGSEYTPIVQSGTTKRAQVGIIAHSLDDNLALVLATSAPVGHSASRKLAGQTGVVSILDGGGSSNITVGLLSSGLSVLGNTSTTAGSAAGSITGTTDQVLRVSSAGTALGFGAVNMASSNAVSNVLGTNFGGTGSSAFTPYQLIIGGSVSSAPFQSVTAGTSGFALFYVSSVASPVWQSIPGFNQAVAGNLAVYTSTSAIGGSPYVNSDSSGTLTIGSPSSVGGKLALLSSAGFTTTIIAGSATATITAPSATTTLIGQNTVDTLTGKTFNTAGSSNHFLINGTSITAVTGNGGTVVLNSTPAISSAAITGGQISAISSFGLRTTGAAFDLIVGSTETLTASRNLNIQVGDATRILALKGDFTIASSFPVAITSTGASSLSVPVTGTLATLAGSETLSNKTFNASNNSLVIGGAVITSATNLLDTIGSSQGQLLYRSSTAWSALTVGTSGQALVGGTIPQWAALAGTGTVTTLVSGTGITLSPATITTSGTISMSSQRQTLPTITVLNSGSSATYSLPANCLWIQVEMVGGGGGGAGSGTTPGNGIGGGVTSFSTSPLASTDRSAGGGGGANTSAGGAGSNVFVGTGFTKNGGTAQNGSGLNATAGGNGGVIVYGGVGWGGAAGGGAGVAAIVNSGAGGGGGGVNTTINGGGGGGAGGYMLAIITSPATSYTYTVGAGGSGGSAGTGGAAGAAGGSGSIFVTEFYNS